MALTFVDASTDKVLYGNLLGASPTTFTALVWGFVTGTTANRRLLSKQDAGGTTGFWNFSVPGAVAAGQMQCTVDYATTDAAARSNNSAYSTSTWHLFGVTFDGVLAPKLFIGSLTALALDITSTVGYAVSNAPSGARVTDNSGNLHIGNDVNLVRGFPGSIAVVGVWNRALTLGEVQDWQFRPRVTAGCQLFTHYGFNGVATQPDWSGNGFAGTVTGATQSAHVPLGKPFGPADGWVPYAVATAAASSAPRRMLMGAGV